MPPDVIVVDHHDSYTWNLVHLVAAVTGVLPRVVQHDEVGAEDGSPHHDPELLAAAYARIFAGAAEEVPLARPRP